MERIRLDEMKFNEPCKISGFVDKLRDTRYMVFVILRDISGHVQVSFDKGLEPEMSAEVLKAIPGSVISIWGELKENAHVKQGGKEFIPTKLVVESIAEPLPIEDNSFIDQKLDYRWIDLRSEKNTLTFEVQTLLSAKMREFLIDNHFVEIHSPKLIGTASESGADVFELKYFDRKAYLAQSPQFYKQMAMASGFERIFETGPVFRAEKSFSNKHATEFTGFDLEISYIDSFHDVMQLEAELLTFTLKAVKEKFGEQIKELTGLEVIVPTLPFPVMKLKDVYQELKDRYGLEVSEEEKGDLTTEAERLCARLAMDKFNSEFLFVTDYDAANRAFYHMRDEKGVPQGYDLIWRGCEITTGAQREHRYDVLRRQANEKGLSEDVKFYMEFFRYGCPPHGGFGIGLDRLTMLLLGLTIKEAMFVFRGPNRLNP
ncbi:MAG: aspartate--tRNA(Asn) ligase [Bacilli bacterium]|jgi:aspartyl-tRNA synthetase|nr:aspartate--tRNA(Asn) ligase [Bacilli bacterium]